MVKLQLSAKDVSKILDVGIDLDLTLNNSKCELIAHDDCLVADSFVHSLPKVSIAEATFLGDPVFPGPALGRTDMLSLGGW